MNQLIFDFASQHYPGFDKFLGQANAELIHVLQSGQAPFVLVWGPEGSGKSHLLRAWVAQAQAQGCSAVYVDAERHSLGDAAAAFDCVAVDQLACLTADEQARLFTLFNDFRQQNRGRLLLSASAPPAQLMLREDVRTRLGWCLVYEIHGLSDDEKIDALCSMARARQLAVDAEVFRYLLLHWRRDLDSLVRMLNTLDDYSLATRRPITVSLLRGLLKQQDGL